MEIRLFADNMQQKIKEQIKKYKDISESEYILSVPNIPCWNTSYIYDSERKCIDKCLLNIKNVLKEKNEEKQKNIITDNVRSINRIIKRWNKGIIGTIPSGVIRMLDQYGSFEYITNYKE